MKIKIVLILLLSNLLISCSSINDRREGKIKTEKAYNILESYPKRDGYIFGFQYSEKANDKYMSDFGYKKTIGCFYSKSNKFTQENMVEASILNKDICIINNKPIYMDVTFILPSGSGYEAIKEIFIMSENPIYENYNIKFSGNRYLGSQKAIFIVREEFKKKYLNGEKYPLLSFNVRPSQFIEEINSKSKSAIDGFLITYKVKFKDFNNQEKIKLQKSKHLINDIINN